METRGETKTMQMVQKTNVKPRIVLESNQRIQIEAIHQQSNLLLIPIYTDWVNRYLVKSKCQPINDLTSELQNPRILINLINAVTVDCVGSAPDKRLLSPNTESKTECVDKCVQFLGEIGVNVAGIQSREILNGELGAILSLLYALSHFKQQQKQLQLVQHVNPKNCANFVSSFKPHPPQQMPPNSGTLLSGPPPSRLSGIRVPQITTPSSPAPQKSRLAPPTRISTTPIQNSKGTKTGLVSPACIPASTTSASKIAAPSVSLKTGTKIKPPAVKPVNPQSRSIEASFHSTSSSSTNTYASIQSLPSSNTQSRILRPPSSFQASHSEQQKSSSSLRPPTASKIAPPPVAAPEKPASTSTGSKMLKLFSSKDKQVKNDAATPPKTETNPPKTSQLKNKPGLKPPSTVSVLQSLDKTKQMPKKSVLDPQNSHLLSSKELARQRETPVRRTGDVGERRLQRFEGEDDVGDLQSSILVSPKHGQRPSREPDADFEESKPSTSGAVGEGPIEQKPMLAVKGITMKPSGLKPPQTAVLNVGVVSPIMASPIMDVEAETSKERLGSPEKHEVDVDLVPMKPINMNVHMNMDQLTGVSRPPQNVVHRAAVLEETSSSSSPVQNFADSKKRRSETYSEGESLACPDTPTKAGSSGYQSTAESMNNHPGVAVYARKMRTSFETSHGSKKCRQHDFSDSFEDSSSLSSGISENFEDLSTDDLTGSSVCEYPMATTTARSSTTDYHGLSFRPGSSKLPNPLPTAHQKHHSPLYGNVPPNSAGKIYSAVPKLDLSGDGDTLSISRNNAGRSSLRYPPSSSRHVNGYQQQQQQQHPSVSMNGTGQIHSHSAQNSPYHSQSLDRHGHLKTFADSSTPNSPYRLSIAPQAMAQSPRNSGMSSEGYHSGRQSVTGSFSARSESSDIYSNYHHGLQLHKLSSINSPLTKVTRMPVPQTGSQASLCSIGGSEEKYEVEIRSLNYEIENYRQTISKLTAKHENYNQMIHMFDSKLQMLVRHVTKLNHKSQLKEEEVEKLKSQIEYLRSFSSCSSGSNNRIVIEGVGELIRHPSMESVSSHVSSMSSASKASKTDKNGFKNGKKSWTANMDNQIRSSFSKVMHKKKPKNGADVEQSPNRGNLHSIAGSANQLDECGQIPEVILLKKELQNKDEVLTDIRMEALDKAREVDILRETVARLANENKALKKNCTLLARRVDTRASSGLSLSTSHDDDPVYDPLPTTTTESSSHMSEKSFSSTSSKRSSGGLATRVCISLEPSGSLEFTPHLHELTIGSLVPPTQQTTWLDIDRQLIAMLREYLHRIEADSTLGIDVEKAIIGYKVGTEMVRDKHSLDSLNSSSVHSPFDAITPTTTIRIRLQGVAQQAVDGLIIESLFPKPILDQLIRLLDQSKRLVINGARGIGKSNLAKTLAKYYSIKLGANGKPESIVDVKYPDDEKDPKFAQVQQNLSAMLKSGAKGILLIDNVQRKFIPHLIQTFKAVDMSGDTPYVICTVNGALQRQVEEIQACNGFRIFQLTNHMDGVRAFMGRYLRRRIAEAELSGHCKCSEQLQVVIDFLGRTLSSINAFIEKANAHDETIGPRTFVQCPLSMEASADWFIRLWNENLVPYMIRAAKEGMILGCKGQLKDPTEFVLEHWPWPDNGDTKLLKKVVFEANSRQSSEFDPMLALERIEQSKKIQNQINIV